MKTFPVRNFGATGFTSVEQIEDVYSRFCTTLKRYAPAIDRFETRKPTLSFGMLSSVAQLGGFAPLSMPLYPEPAFYPCLFEAARQEGSRGVLHYYTTTKEERLGEELLNAVEVCGPYIGGIQLNTAWPSVSAIEGLREHNPGLHIVLQLNKAALGTVSVTNEFKASRCSPELLCEKLSPYLGCINGVLLDGSDGTGLPLDADLFQPLVSALSVFPQLEIGVAGGLSKDTVSRIGCLHHTCRYLSVDAESRLVDTATRKIHPPSVGGYLEALCQYFYTMPVAAMAAR